MVKCGKWLQTGWYLEDHSVNPDFQVMGPWCPQVEQARNGHDPQVRYFWPFHNDLMDFVKVVQWMTTDDRWPLQIPLGFLSVLLAASKIITDPFRLRQSPLLLALLLRLVLLLLRFLVGDTRRLRCLKSRLHQGKLEAQSKGMDRGQVLGCQWSQGSLACGNLRWVWINTY